MDVLNYFALGILFFLFIGGAYLVIYIHDIPYEIAKRRNHPHLEAIHIAGWVSLVLMHAIWPLLWIWAYLFTSGPDRYAEDEEEDFEDDKKSIDKELAERDREYIQELTLEINKLKEDVEFLSQKVDSTNKN